MAPEYGLWRLDAGQRRPASLVADLLATGTTLRGNTISEDRSAMRWAVLFYAGGALHVGQRHDHAPAL